VTQDGYEIEESTSYEYTVSTNMVTNVA